MIFPKFEILNIKAICAVGTIVLVFLAIRKIALSQIVVPTPPPPGSIQAIIPFNNKPYQQVGVTKDGWGWTTVEWNGDDRPYQLIRLHIDRAIANGASSVELVKEYKSIADNDPKNPLAEFQYGYAAWKCYRDPLVPSWKGQNGLDGVIDGGAMIFTVADSLAYAKFPRTYDYGRLRFLVESVLHDTAELDELGDRLLKGAPHDNDLSIQIVYNLMNKLPYDHNQRHEIEKAWQIVHAYIKQNPDDMNDYSLQFSIYFSDYFSVSHSDDSAKKSIQMCQALLRLTPSDFAGRDQEEHVIGMLQNRLHENK